MYSPGQMEAVLRLYSFVSRCGSSVKNFLYDRNLRRPSRAPLPVISVGNISLGGTGKTPLAIELLSWLAARGRRPALVSRGYRGRWEKSGGTFSDGRSILGTWREGGDEPAMIAAALPRAGVFVGRDRLVSCRKARELGFDTAVLDDGFQHRRVARDFDIVIYSPSPRVPLRESPAGLRRADVIAVEAHAADPDGTLSPPADAAGAIVSYSVASRGFRDTATGEPLPASALRGERLVAFCGIARPERFRDRLSGEGLEIGAFLAFPDHHAYPEASLAKILAAAQAHGARRAVTTAKDAVKLADRLDFLGALDVAVLEIGLKIDPRLFTLLEAALAKSTRPNV